VPFARDPLSARYDPAARDLVTRAIRAFAGSDAKDPRWIRAVVESPAGDQREPVYGMSTRGLSVHERAFQRALYYDARVYHRSGEKSWSLVVDWDIRISGQLEGRQQRRLLRVRVFRDTAGFRFVKRREGRSYARDPARRSVAAVIRQP
jgi:hypothetical protein